MYAKIEKKMMGKTNVSPSATRSRFRFNQLMRRMVGIRKAESGKREN
jgi:hypothetical protein